MEVTAFERPLRWISVLMGTNFKGSRSRKGLDPISKQLHRSGIRIPVWIGIIRGRGIGIPSGRSKLGITRYPQRLFDVRYQAGYQIQYLAFRISKAKYPISVQIYGQLSGRISTVLYVQ